MYTGTKECEQCKCGGDPSKCDFYPEMRKEVKAMNTAEMWLKAQEDNKWYKCHDVAYNNKIGFVHAEDLTTPWFDESDTCVSIENFFSASGWEEYDLNIMTKDEAEKKYGIKIVG